MNILYFAPTATPQNPSMCPFITQRIFELQRQGHKVVTIQYGNLSFLKPFKTKRVGIIRLIAILYKVFYFVFFKKKNKIKIFASKMGTFSYYDQLTFFSVFSFYKWFKRMNFDLIHCHFLWYANILPELKNKFNIPYVVTIHGSDIHEITPYDKETISIALNILNNADNNIFISNYLLNHAKMLGYDGHNAKVIYNGYNSDIFFLNKEGKKKDFYLLGFVGHPIFIKRADVLPIVLKLVQKKIPNTKMIILGSESGDLVPYMKLQACLLGLQNDIQFIPSVPPDQVGEYMRQFDVLLFPSRNDGFGCVAIEAQACGVGVLGSANGGIPEAVGENGVCIPESENFISDYADAIIKWLREDHNKVKISESVKEFTWHNCVKFELNVYREVCHHSDTALH